MTGVEIVGIVCGAAAIIAVAVQQFFIIKLVEQSKSLRASITTLEQKVADNALANQRELLAVGQVVLEADKLVKHFSERIDAIENAQNSDQPQYGQVQNLLKQATTLQSEASAAEMELKTLLTRQRKMTS